MIGKRNVGVPRLGEHAGHFLHHHYQQQQQQQYEQYHHHTATAGIVSSSMMPLAVGVVSPRSSVVSPRSLSSAATPFAPPLPLFESHASGFFQSPFSTSVASMMTPPPPPSSSSVSSSISGVSSGLGGASLDDVLGLCGSNTFESPEANEAWLSNWLESEC